VGSICLHRGEEPVFGEQGICNIFFTHCNLKCLYCQNHQISRSNAPNIAFTLTERELLDQVEACLEQYVACVGFVSPSHVLPQVEAIMAGLQQRGRKPVFVMNTNAYDKAEKIASLESRMNVYLPDLKYLDSDLAEAYSGARDYPEVAQKALKEMFRQKGPELRLDARGIIQSGLIIRHLVLPGQVENSKAVLRFIAQELSKDVTLSLMAQYAPIPAVVGHPLLGRNLLAEEYEQVLAEMDRLGLENGWMQALESQNHYCPDFAQTHPFEKK
jgi:putative pyruvate formate lyase activating enzyme